MLRNGSYLVWCTAEFQYTVILECAVRLDCWPLVRLHVCDWLTSVSLKVLGDSREQCGCLWFPDGLYCGGRWYVFLRKGLSCPFSPSSADPPPLHPLHKHTSTHAHTHSRDLATLPPLQWCHYLCAIMVSVAVVCLLHAACSVRVCFFSMCVRQFDLLL